MSVTARTGSAGSPESTWRIRTPEQTWSLLQPRLEHYGITRIADLTELDVIGVPVYMGVRPLATTLSVSQGKGMTHLLAQVSAAMEAVEYWAAERFRPAEAWYAPAAELCLPYRVEEVTPTERSVAILNAVGLPGIDDVNYAAIRRELRRYDEPSEDIAPEDADWLDPDPLSRPLSVFCIPGEHAVNAELLLDELNLAFLRVGGTVIPELAVRVEYSRGKVDGVVLASGTRLTAGHVVLAAGRALRIC